MNPWLRGRKQRPKEEEEEWSKQKYKNTVFQIEQAV